MKNRDRSRLWPLRIVLFLAVFLIVFETVSMLFQPKWTVGDFKGYARLTGLDNEQTSLDVVFVGSSHAWVNINPLILFQSQGITSYDYGTQGQGILLSEQYVKHAIESKHPDVIALEAHFLYYIIPAPEEALRKWMSPIELSLEKIKLIKQVKEEHEQFGYGYDMGPASSYVFPILRFHSRWNELGRDDFEPDAALPHYHKVASYHGFAPIYYFYPGDFSEYYDEVFLNEEEVAAAKECFGRIAEICRDSGTKLLLLKVPSPSWRKGYNDLMTSWAEEFDVPFFDMNDYVDEIGINGSEDIADITHLNVYGAEKTSLYLGQYLRENYDLPDHRGDAAYAGWEDDWQVYLQDKAAGELQVETNWAAYLQKLQNPNYTVYITAKDNLGGGAYPELTGQLKTLGLTQVTDNAGLVGYMAIIDGGNVVYENIADEPLTYETDINGHHVELISESYYQGNRGSIRLDGIEQFADYRGVGFVVYDNVLEDVVDRATFDLLVGGIVYREAQ